MNTKERFEYMRPLIEDAARHNNRALLVDLVKPYIQYIEENYDNCIDEEEEQAAKAIISWLKAYLIDNAWDKRIHKHLNPTPLEKTHKGIHLSDETQAGSHEHTGMEDGEEGGRVLRGNTPVGTRNAMREVLSPANHFETQTAIILRESPTNPKLTKLFWLYLRLIFSLLKLLS
jgi:hypothetical protein